MSPKGSMEAWNGHAAKPLALSLLVLGGGFWLGGVLLKTCTLDVVLVLYLWPVALDTYPLPLEHPIRSE